MKYIILSLVIAALTSCTPNGLTFSVGVTTPIPQTGGEASGTVSYSPLDVADSK